MKKLIYYIFLPLLITGFLTAEPHVWKRLIAADTFDIAANPQNFNTIYAGGIGRLVYRTWDAGITWDTFEIIYRGGTAILNNVLVHPVDTNVIIVGGITFGEIQRSTDNGETWNAVLTRVRPITLNGKAMMFDEKNTDIIYLGDFQTGDIYRSIDRGATWDSISTAKNWTKAYDSEGNIVDTLMYITIGSMGIREDSTNILFANSTAGEVLMSKDSGVTWNFIQDLVVPGLEKSDCEITRMVFSPRDPLTGYAVITYLFFGNTPNGGLFKTTDGGYSWFLQALQDTSMWAVAVREFNGEDEVFVGGYTEDFYVMDSVKVQGDGIVRRSQDGGKTWYNYDGKIDWWNKNFRSSSNINYTYFQSSKLGFLCGNDGTLWRSIDSGKRWLNYSYEIYKDIYATHFYSLYTGFIAGQDGFIFKTLNSAMKWTPVVSNTNNTIYSITFLDSAKGIAAGKNGTIIISTNEGLNWQNVNSGTDNTLRSLKIISANRAIAVGEEGTIVISNNLGDTWAKVESGTVNNLNSVFFYDEQLGFIAGDNGTLLETNDGGNSWFPIESEYILNFNSVFFVNNNIGFIAADDGVVLKTTDKGNSFVETVLNSKWDINSIAFTDELNGTAAGDFRMVYATTDGGLTWDTKLFGYGATANMWSLRYLGPIGQERLFMASEAGLFVLDDPSPVIEYKKDSRQGILFVSQEDAVNFRIRYSRIKPDWTSSTNFRIYDLMGRVVYQNNTISDSETIEFNIRLPEISPGLYICQMLDDGELTTLKAVFK